MGIFDRFFKNKAIIPATTEAKAADIVKTITYSQQATGKTGITLGKIDYLNEEKNLQTMALYNVWVSASIRAISRNAITPPIKLYNPDTKQEIANLELINLINNPHPDFDYSRWLKYIISNRELYGDAYIYKIRAGNKVIALQPLPSELVTLDETAIQKGIYEYRLQTGGRVITIPRADLIIWSDNEYTTSYYSGTSKLKHLLFTIINKNNADRFQKASFENGGEVKGIIAWPGVVTKDDKDYMLAEMKSRHGGADNSGKFMLLGGDPKLLGTGQTNDQMGFELLNKATKEEVLSIYKVPPIELGLTDSVNYNNAREQRRLFWETCLTPMLDSLATALTLDLIKEKKLNLAFYYDYSVVPAMQQDLANKLNQAMTMQIIGYDNATITEYLDLPEIKESKPEPKPPAAAADKPAEDEPKAAKAHGSIPNHIKSVFRDTAKAEFSKAHAGIENQFKTMIQKFFLRWRNDVLDAVKREIPEKKVGDPGPLFQYLDERLQSAEAELEKIGMVMFTRTADQVAARMVRLYGLEWTDSVKTGIMVNHHTERITTMVNETVDVELRARIRDAYTQGTLENFSTQDLANKIIDDVKDVYKMADKRAVLIARTETTAMANDIMTEQFKENGIEKLEWLTSQDDAVRTIADGAEFDHAAMDGVKTPVGVPFSVPGKNGAESMYYPGDMSSGSPGNVCNCFIPDTVVEGNFLNILKARYSGPVREIVTRRGYRLTVTINHPILTAGGWIPAGKLDKGINLITYSADIGNSFLSDPNNQNSPAIVQNVFDTLASYRTPRRVMIRALDFHGDGELVNDSKIDIINMNGKLPLDIHGVIRNKAGHDLDFIKPEILLGFVSPKSATDLSVAPGFTTSPFDPCVHDLTLDKRGMLFDFGPFQTLGIGTPANWYTGMGESSKQEGATISGFIGKLLERATGNIAFDEIVDIRDYDFSGHVYDLQSIDDYIVSNGIVSSNCRCTIMPFDSEVEE